MKKIMLCVSALVLALLSSCRHKDLMYDEPLTQEVDVVFDWSEAPEATPSSMALYLYNRDTGEHLRFIFAGRDGGRIRIPFGTYDALGLNSDNEDWALFRNTDDIDEFETYTHDVSETGTEMRYVSDMEGQKTDFAPDHLWTGRTDGFELKVTDRRKTLVIVPKDIVCHYTVEVDGVVNGSRLERSTVEATLCDLAEGFLNGCGITSETKVTVPFALRFSKSGDILTGEFLTFGEPSRDDRDNILTLIFPLGDGSVKKFTFDVTDQVESAPDPKNVFIKVSGVTIPEDNVSLGGLIPDVNGWGQENIDIKMIKR